MSKKGPKVETNSALALADRIDAILDEFSRGCSNTQIADLPPEHCPECARGAFDAIRSAVKKARRAERHQKSS
jgi:hypothetical protein